MCSWIFSTKECQTKGIITYGKSDGFILINECNPFKGEELNLNIKGTLLLYVYDIKNAKFIPTY